MVLLAPLQEAQRIAKFEKNCEIWNHQIERFCTICNLRIMPYTEYSYLRTAGFHPLVDTVPPHGSKGEHLHSALPGGGGGGQGLCRASIAAQVGRLTKWAHHCVP